MELLIGLIIIAGIGYLTYRNLNKQIEEKHADSTPEAPYKVEPQKVHVVDVGSASPTEAVAIVEQAQAEVAKKLTKTKKPSAKKNSGEKVAKATTPRKTTKKAK